MGIKCAPALANMYISILEKSFLDIHRPLIYRRFVDDIFAGFNRNFDINILKSHFGYLKLNIVSEEEVTFLDLKISLNKFTCKLDFNMYLKPTNTFSYLLSTSNHPDFIFKNIPKSIFFRTRRICTFLFDYYYFTRLFRLQFISRGYSPILLDKCCRMIASLNRDEIIPYKIRERNFVTEDKLFFKIPFNFNFLNLKNFFNDYKFLSDYNKNCTLKLVNNIEPNISRIFVHNFKI